MISTGDYLPYDDCTVGVVYSPLYLPLLLRAVRANVSIHLFCLSVCLLVFNETWGNDSYSVYWLAQGGRHNYRSELWILISSRVAPTRRNNTYSAALTLQICLPDHQYTVRVFSAVAEAAEAFLFMSRLTRSGAASCVGMVTGFTFYFCFHSRFCCGSPPRLVCVSVCSEFKEFPACLIHAGVHV